MSFIASTDIKGFIDLIAKQSLLSLDVIFQYAVSMIGVSLM